MLKAQGQKGQMSLEYVAVLIILVGALLAMQNYFKRGIQGRMKASVDSVGEQYDPLTTTGDITQRVQGTTTTTVTVVGTPDGGKETIRSDNSSMTETKSGSVTVVSH